VAEIFMPEEKAGGHFSFRYLKANQSDLLMVEIISA